MPKLREYQNELEQSILTHIEDNQKCCASLATGGGKTFVFCSLATKLKGKVLILVNREELVKQTVDSFHNVFGIQANIIIAATKRIIYGTYTVGMTQTIESRFKRLKFDYNAFDYIIIDECHRLEFNKAHENFTGKIIGFTATPVIQKRQVIETETGKKISKRIPLSDYYDTLIEGADIEFLINEGFLVPEEVYQTQKFTKEGLKVDSKTGDYTTQSLNDKFDSKDVYDELNEVFDSKLRGKKTIVFNPSTKINEKVYIKLVQQGYPVRMYDSVNNKKSERKDTVKWFKNTPGAVLCNVNTFTTGFDVKEVEAIVLNRSTTSLSLYHQMVGRGGRITDLIYKDKFILIDLGGNVAEFGNWSDNRDWKEHFYDDSEKIITESLDAKDANQCDECGAFISPRASICEYCGAEQKKKEKILKQVQSTDLVRTKKVAPNANKLVEYCMRNNLTLNDAKKILYKSIVEMFNDTPKEVVERNIESGELFNRAKIKFRKDYFILHRSDLEGSRKHKLDTFINNIINNIALYYNI